MSSPGGDPRSSPEGEAVTPPGPIRTVILPSPQSSQKSPSNLPDLLPESLSAPEWRNKEEAVEYFLKVKKALRSILYRHVKALQEAMNIYEQHHATHFKNYDKLKDALVQDWNKWKDFSQQKIITVEVLVHSVIYSDLNARRFLLVTPKIATKKARSLMQSLRDQVTAINNQLSSIRAQVTEAIARLEESQNGHESEPFPEIMTMESLPDPEPFEIATTPTDTESETEEDFIARGGIREEADLPKHGLDPVWTSWGGYPGEVPDDIKEYLNDDGTRPGCQYVGSIKSLFWIAGYDEIVRAIDDPAYILNDEILYVPDGRLPGSFLISWYLDQGTMPILYGDILMGNRWPRPVSVMVLYENAIPPQVATELQVCDTSQLYRSNRPQCLPAKVNCVRVKHPKKTEKFLSNVQKAIGSALAKGDLWFRGLGHSALILSLAFFIPVINPNAYDNEFGPGIYTTNDFEYAASYCPPEGVLMVFKDPDLRGLKVWEPTLDEWKHLVANWLKLSLSNIVIPEKYKDADIIRGPISTRLSLGKKQLHFPEQGSQQQMVAVSYDGCKALSASLHTIIFSER